MKRRFALINKTPNALNAVLSFNTRVGAVVPAAGDYDAFYYTETESDTLFAKLADDETITGAWTFPTVKIDTIHGNDSAAELIIYGGIGTGANIELYGGSHSTLANFAIYDAVSHTFREHSGASTYLLVNSSGITVDGDVSGTTIGGILEANLLDKSAVEAITGAWTFASIDGVLAADSASLRQSFCGIVFDSPDIGVISDGATITFSVEKTGGGDLRFWFTAGMITLDTTPAATLALTAGTDIAPQINFVYVLQSTGLLTASTSGFPVGVEYAPLATVLCQSAASAQTDGLYKVHAWTDHVSSAELGHLGHVNFWIRQQAATWDSGTLLTPTAGAAQFDIAVSSGTILQLHPHAFPSFSTSTGSEVMVVNDFTTPYTRSGDLTTILTDALGNSMTTKYYNLVVWGVVSEDFADCQLMVNVPTDTYNNSADAIVDIDATAVYDIPTDFKGTGFLIARLTVRHQNAAGGTFTVEQNDDLRGLFPSTGAGGIGSGAAGVTELIELTDVDTAASTANFVLATPDGAPGQYSGRALVKGDIDGLTLDLGALTATSYGGITEANLLDKSVAETVSGGQWSFGNTTNFTAGIRTNNDVFYRSKEFGGTSRSLLGINASDVVVLGTGVLATSILGTSVDVSAALTATSYSGITETNLLDKAAPETISGTYTFDDPIFMLERAAAAADVAGDGQIWVKSDTPNTLWFTNDAGTDVQLGVSGSSTPNSFVFYAPSQTVTLTNQAIALQWFASLNRNRTKLDLSGYTQVRVVALVSTASVSANSPRLVMRYRTTDNTTASNWTLDLGTSEVSCSFSSTGLIDTGWINLAAAAIADNIYMGLLMIGGNNTADPGVGGIVIHLQ